MSTDDALAHARRLVAPVQRRRGASLATTELFSDDGREPEHLGLRSEVERLREGLSVTIEVQVRGEAWRQRAELAGALLAVGTGAALGLAVAAFVAVAVAVGGAP